MGFSLILTLSIRIFNIVNNGDLSKHHMMSKASLNRLVNKVQMSKTLFSCLVFLRTLLQMPQWSAYILEWSKGKHILGPRSPSAHTWLSSPYCLEQKFLACMFPKSPSIISPNHSEIICKVLEPKDNFLQYRAPFVSPKIACCRGKGHSPTCFQGA